MCHQGLHNYHSQCTQWGVGVSTLTENWLKMCCQQPMYPVWLILLVVKLHGNVNLPDIYVFDHKLWLHHPQLQIFLEMCSRH